MQNEKGNKEKWQYMFSHMLNDSTASDEKQKQSHRSE